jgi:adenylate cyclase
MDPTPASAFAESERGRLPRRLYVSLGAFFLIPAGAAAALCQARGILFEPDSTAVLLTLLAAGWVGFRRLMGALRRAAKTSAGIAGLREGAELCHASSDPEEILYATLERALALTGSDLGSLLTLDPSERRSFVVRATIGLEKFIRSGDRIDFDTSIAKYAVINKTPLCVADIEKDKRFGRANLPQYGTKSFLCLPMRAGGDIIGVLTVSSRNRRRVYLPEEAEVLAPLLSTAAFACENLDLKRGNHRLARHLDAVIKIARMCTSGFRDEELLQAVLLELQGILPCERAAVLVPEEGKPDLARVRALAMGPGGLLSRSELLAMAGSLAETALAQESVVTLERPEPLGTELDRWIFGGLSGRFCLVAPLKAGGRTGGFIAAVNDRREPLAAVEGLAGWVGFALGLALDRNRLQAAVSKRDQEMQTIRQVGSALAYSTFDMDKVLGYTMDLVREVMKVEAGSLYFVKDGGLEAAAGFSQSDLRPVAPRLPLDRGITGYSASRGEAVMISEPEKFRPGWVDAAGERGLRTRSALCVPMISQGSVIGVIDVRNKMHGGFDDGDRELLQAIAASVSIALENARLYKKTAAAAEQERDLRRMFQKFVPKEVVDRIVHGESGSAPVMEELKMVTLLNVDIRGFSKMSRRTGSRRIVRLLNRFFAVMGEIVFAHGGIVDKYLGDGFLAIFGAPVSNGDDAEHAVSAALKMPEALERANREWRSDADLAVEMGISLHTGEVVAGNIGFEKKMDYTVVGDAVNAVFRMQTLCKGPRNGIILSDRTLAALRQPPDVEEIDLPAELQAELSGLRAYRLRAAAAAGPPAAGA